MPRYEIMGGIGMPPPTGNPASVPVQRKVPARNSYRMFPVLKARLKDSDSSSQ